MIYNILILLVIYILVSEVEPKEEPVHSVTGSLGTMNQDKLLKACNALCMRSLKEIKLSLF